MTDRLPPLVEPAPELTREELRRYGRHLSLPQIGSEGQRRLKAARVLVVGAGGLGSPALQCLAGAGVGTLGVVDDDEVSLSNLQRQTVHGTEDVGRLKTASARDAVHRINPLVRVAEHPVRLEADNAAEILAGYDLVLDGADNFAARYLVSDAAERAGIPVVWGSILRFEAQASVFWVGRGPVYRDLYPEPPAPGEVPSCAEGGVLGTLPAVIGSVMAAEAIKLITGTGRPLLGRLLVHDSLEQTWREVAVLSDPDRVPPASLGEVPGEDEAAVCGAGGSEEVSAAELRRMLQRREAGGAEFAVVDVREEWERELSAIPGSVRVPLAELLERGRGALPPEARGVGLVLHCATGQRSARALAALRPEFAGREEPLRHLAGGIEAWERDGRPAEDRTSPAASPGRTSKERA